ncbi:MAG: hypothetical protein S4CHLAM2_06670 [Chlamydiales bacterium]|nr:hypothetical protein [Chlamydiales bacterium]
MAGSTVTEDKRPDQIQPLQASPAAEKSDGQTPKFNYFTILFYLLVDAMQTRQDTVLTQSKVLEANSAAQQKLNKENAQIKFSILPEGAKNPTINRVQDQNQQYAASREDIQNSLITCRQTAQVEMTQTTTNVNLLQQDASEDSGWLKTLNTIFQVINELTKR